MEMGLLFLPAAVFLIWQEASGQGSIGHLDWTVNVALLATGVLTVMPLLWFAEAARRIPMTLLGVFQYIAPTIQFIIGIAIYHEPFSAGQAGRLLHHLDGAAALLGGGHAASPTADSPVADVRLFTLYPWARKNGAFRLTI